MGPEDTRVTGGGVSLVWNIGYEREYHLVTRIWESSRSSGRREVFEPTGRRTSAYKCITVSGDRERNSIRIRGRKDELESVPTYHELVRRFGDDNNIPREYRGVSWGEPGHDMRRALGYVGNDIILNPLLRSRYISITMSGTGLNKSEIKQALASIYIDTKESSSEEKLSWWPFDKTVPEQDKLHVPEKLHKL